MKQIAVYAWCFFFMLLFFGLWTIPILIGIWIAAQLIARYKPQWFEKL